MYVVRKDTFVFDSQSNLETLSRIYVDLSTSILLSYLSYIYIFSLSLLHLLIIRSMRMLQQSVVGGPILLPEPGMRPFLLSAWVNNVQTVYIVEPQRKQVRLRDAASGKRVGVVWPIDDPDQKWCITGVEDETQRRSWLVLASRSGAIIQVVAVNDLLIHPPSGVVPRVSSLVSTQTEKPLTDAGLSYIAAGGNDCLFAMSEKLGLLKVCFSSTMDSVVPFSVVVPLKRMKPVPSCELKIWNHQKPATIVVIHSAHQLMLYIDDVDSPRIVDLKSFLSNDPLTTVQISPTTGALACGFFSGTVQILHHILASAAAPHATAYSLKSSVVVQTLHWHAHAVAAMAYVPSSGELYTGGAESVLVTWSGEAAMKPFHTLPRVAPAGIAHLLVAAEGPVLVWGQDQSLQAYETDVSKQRLWSVQGLAVTADLPAENGEETTARNERIPVLWCTPNAPTLLAFSGLDQAPGSIHWYDTEEQCVVRRLDVVPFNRISGTDRNVSHTTPVVTHSAFCQEVLCTVDVVPTENACLGHQGWVTTIRFWHASAAATYECVAAMTAPHGPSHRIHALALSQRGSAITVSNDEKALRLWQQNSGASEWICRCKVSLPSGYANENVTAVAFSNDTSVFAVAFGAVVTLWDHVEVKLLTSFRQCESATDVVERIQFLPHDSRILLQSPLGVSVRSPYTNGPTDASWSWIVPSETTDNAIPRTKKPRRNPPKGMGSSTRISQIHYLPQSDLVVLVQYSAPRNDSRIILVDAMTGELYSDETPVAHIPSYIRSWSVIEHGRNAFSFYCLTGNGELLCLSNHAAPTAITRLVVEEALSPAVPLLSTKSTEQRRSKRRHLWGASEDDTTGVPKLVVPWEAQLGGVEGPNSANVPLLRGSFVRSFLGRRFGS